MLPRPGFITYERIPRECTLWGGRVPVLVRLNDTMMFGKG